MIDKFDSEEQVITPEDLLKKRQDEYNLTISELVEMYDRFPILLDVRSCFLKSEFFGIAEFMRLWNPKKRNNILRSRYANFRSQNSLRTMVFMMRLSLISRKLSGLWYWSDMLPISVERKNAVRNWKNNMTLIKGVHVLRLQ